MNVLTKTPNRATDGSKRPRFQSLLLLPLFTVLMACAGDDNGRMLRLADQNASEGRVQEAYRDLFTQDSVGSVLLCNSIKNKGYEEASAAMAAWTDESWIFPGATVVPGQDRDERSDRVVLEILQKECEQLPMSRTDFTRLFIRQAVESDPSTVTGLCRAINILGVEAMARRIIEPPPPQDPLMLTVLSIDAEEEVTKEAALEILQVVVEDGCVHLPPQPSVQLAATPTGQDERAGAISESVRMGLGTEYLGNCSFALVEGDASKMCSIQTEEREGVHAYLLGPTFASFSHWMFVERINGQWTVIQVTPVLVPDPYGFSDTPWPLRLGADVVLSGRAMVATPDCLNIREIPGSGARVIRCLKEGEPLKIVAGPTKVDDMNWWQVELPVDRAVGWVEEPYLRYGDALR